MPGKKGGLGAAIQKARMKKTFVKPSELHSEDLRKPDDGLKSFWDGNDMEEFFTAAAAANRDFTAQRNVQIVPTANTKVLIIDNKVKPDDNIERWAALSEKLTIPRRPKWEGKTAEEVDRNERDVFLHWRRFMAKVEDREGVFMTPFEKNLEVWRQLWRVMERSEIICNILDARNPLLFRCADLERYVNDAKNKKLLLLLNKADYLTTKQRSAWARYLTSKGLPFAFFSAHIATETDDATVDVSEIKPPGDGYVPPQQDNPGHILSRSELLQYFMHLCRPTDSTDKPFTAVVGMVGYPNVGKSSTINAIFGKKKVIVSQTPGKTKHFQTLIVNDHLTLCDCPGLVFPSFASTKESMIVDGILSVDQMRDYAYPIRMIADRVPAEVLEMLYGINMEVNGKDEDSCESKSELLVCQVGRVRGYMTDHDKPNKTKAAREILKDYQSGKLLYVHPPPNYEVTEDEDDEEEKTEGKGGAAEEEWLTDEEDEEEADEEDEDEEGAEKDDDSANELGEEMTDDEDDGKQDNTTANFNAKNVNLGDIYNKMLSKKKKKKKKTNHQLEEEDDDVVMEDGVKVMSIDRDEPIMAAKVNAKEKQPTKRQMRKAQKAMRGTVVSANDMLSAH